MALTTAQLEALYGNFLRLLVTHLDGPVATRVLDPLATGLANAGRSYVLNGTLGTPADRLEAMRTLAQGLYQALGYGNPTDGARGQHGFDQHWLPAKQRGEV
jgi:hypothetical protein